MWYKYILVFYLGFTGKHTLQKVLLLLSPRRFLASPLAAVNLCRSVYEANLFCVRYHFLVSTLNPHAAICAT